MSRIGRKPIIIPADVEVKLDGTKVTVKGPKGTLEREIHRDMKVTMEGNELIVTRPSDDKDHRSLHGLTRTLISNMVEGVVKPFEKKLEANGVGYRVAVQGNDLVMNLGYSHQVIMAIPSNLEVKVEPGNKMTVTGCDKQEVGQFAAEIRTKRPPEPYLGKGIKYADEVIRRKEGKAGKGGKK